MLEAVKARFPPIVRKYCGRLKFLGMAVFGLYTCLNVLEGFHHATRVKIGTYGFWPDPPTTTIPFSGLFQGRCVALFQGASILTNTFPDTIFLYSYFNAYAFIGICTKASIEVVDSIFGSKNRMFAAVTPFISGASPEQQFVVFGKDVSLSQTLLGPFKWMFGAGSPYFHSTDTVCTSVADAKSCCTSSSSCASAFTDVVPPGFNSVSFWQSYIGFKSNLFDSLDSYSPCNQCGMYVIDNSAAPLCDSKAGFYPVFYWSSSLPFFYYSNWALLLQVFSIACEAILVGFVLARKLDVRNLVVGTFCPFFFALFSWFPCSPLYIDTGSQDNFDAPNADANRQGYNEDAWSRRFATVIYGLGVMNTFCSGIVYTGLQISGGCSSFPGQLLVVALLVYNIVICIFSICPYLLRNGSGPITEYYVRA
jgi:hypothetical protein